MLHQSHGLLRSWLTAAALAVTCLAFAAPASAVKCPLIPEWCSCNYCATSRDCSCRMREGGTISCSIFYANGGCLNLAAAESDEAAETPADVEATEPTLEELLARDEAAPDCL